jgi:hypothetical protein
LASPRAQICLATALATRDRKCLAGLTLAMSDKCGFTYTLLFFSVTFILSHPSLSARLAQSVEHETLNLRVVGSSPTLGELFC